MKFLFTQSKRMSLTIIKAGILDTVQDSGRFGYQGAGINPGGAMDPFSARLANSLLGKRADAPVLELHFPAARILLGEATIICITGANFYPAIDDQEIPMNQPVVVNKGTVVQFKKQVHGARCYIAVWQDLQLPKWLNSYSTNLKAGAGGFEGRALQTGDTLHYKSVRKIVSIHRYTYKQTPVLLCRSFFTLRHYQNQRYKR